MEIDTLVRYLVVGLIAGGMFLGWILLLGGVSAVQSQCDGNCRSLTGLTWWIVWLQLIIYIAAVPIQLGKLQMSQKTVTFFLAILATLEMYEANELLDEKASFGHSNRINATVAGHAVLAAFNVMLILFIGFIPHTEYDDDSSPSNDPGYSKGLPPVPGAHPMKPMTSRASSMRASSPPASEASYPAVPRR